MPADQRRASIIAAARPLLIRHGVNVTTRQIAEAAGIAEGTVFRVFPDKDALLAAVMADATDPAPLEQALARIDPGLPFEDRLVLAVEIVRRRMRGIWELAAATGLPPRPNAKPPRSAALVALFAAEAERISRPPTFAADALRALTLAMTHPHLTPSTSLTARDIVRLFLDGIGSHPGVPAC